MDDEYKAERLKSAVQHAFEHMIPFNRVLGLSVDSIDADAPRLRFDMRPELVGNPIRQILHGGVISATLDVVGGLAVTLALAAKLTMAANKVDEIGTDDSSAVPPFPNIGTIDLRIDYLRPGRGQYFVATGRIVRLGGRVAVVHSELVNDADEQIATGAAAYMVG